MCIRSGKWVLRVLFITGLLASGAAQPGRGYPYPEWTVTQYTGLQNCAMAKDASRVLAVESNALHVFDTAGAETATLALPFTEVTGFAVTPDASRAVVVGWDNDDSRVLVASADGRVLFTTTLPGDGEEFFDRGAISPDGATVALLISGAGQTKSNDAANPEVRDRHSIEFLSATGDRLWQTPEFDGFAAMPYLMGRDFVLAGSTVWDWKKKSQAALGHAAYGLSEPALTNDGAIVSVDYTNNEPGLAYQSAAGERLRSIRLPSQPLVFLPSAQGGALYSDGRGYHLVDSTGEVEWEHAMAHPIQHDSMDLSANGRLVALSYLVSPMYRPTPESMSQFNALRFAHEFYVFDVDRDRPRWSLLPENPRLTTIRLSADGANWVICGDNEIEAFHYQVKVTEMLGDVGRGIVRYLFGPS